MNYIDELKMISIKYENQIKEYNIQKRILDAKIEQTYDIKDSIESLIGDIEREQK